MWPRAGERVAAHRHEGPEHLGGGVPAARAGVLGEHRVAQRGAEFQLRAAQGPRGVPDEQGAVDDVAWVVAVEFPARAGAERLDVGIAQPGQEELGEGEVGTPNEHDLLVLGNSGAGSKPCTDRPWSEPAHSEMATPSSQPVDVTWRAALPVSRMPSNIQ